MENLRIREQSRILAQNFCLCGNLLGKNLGVSQLRTRSRVVVKWRVGKCSASGASAGSESGTMDDCRVPQVRVRTLDAKLPRRRTLNRAIGGHFWTPERPLRSSARYLLIAASFSDQRRHRDISNRCHSPLRRTRRCHKFSRH